jgi:hypothetical protein
MPIDMSVNTWKYIQIHENDIEISNQYNEIYYKYIQIH